MRIIIRFKSGFELPITCDSFNLKFHPVTDEITEYEVVGAKDFNPIFFRSEDVECVFKNMIIEETENDIHD